MGEDAHVNWDKEALLYQAPKRRQEAILAFSQLTLVPNLYVRSVC
jgi:hypothetical protein